MSAAITVFLKKIGRERRIPFEISADPFYSERNINYLNKVIDGIEDGTSPLTEHDLIEDDEEWNWKRLSGDTMTISHFEQGKKNALLIFIQTQYLCRFLYML